MDSRLKYGFNTNQDPTFSHALGPITITKDEPFLLPASLPPAAVECPVSDSPFLKFL
jgi:hypothetical protein